MNREAARELIDRAREGMPPTEAWQREVCPPPPQPCDRFIDGEDGYAWVGRIGAARLKVIVSANRETDGKRWLHVSVSSGARGQRVDWYDLVRVKNLFIGRDKYAIQVFPPESQYVNIHDVWHLWSCLDGHPLPEFSRGLGTI